MQINGRKIGGDNPPYICAEISGNHCGSYDKCALLMGMAIGAGADAVKLQCYTPDTITLDCNKPDFLIKDGPWKGRTLHELYQKAHTPLEWMPDLFALSRRYGFTLFASVFDRTSVDLLEKLDCPAYKIASMEIKDTNLIGYVAKTGKPLIISTGMANENEIVDAVRSARKANGVAVLKCTSGYPSSIEESDLRKLSRMEWYNNPEIEVGISDHTLGWEIPVAATALGATIIEKHLCQSRSDPTEDAAFSLEPEEFKKMCAAVRSVWKAMQPSEAKSEESSRQLRRSLYVTANMKTGDTFTEQNVRSIRPSYGLAPKYLPDILGKKAKRDIERGESLQWEMIDATT